jgi:hypothetical protein
VPLLSAVRLPLLALTDPVLLKATPQVKVVVPVPT